MNNNIDFLGTVKRLAAASYLYQKPNVFCMVNMKLLISCPEKENQQPSEIIDTTVQRVKAITKKHYETVYALASVRGDAVALMQSMSFLGSLVESDKEQKQFDQFCARKVHEEMPNPNCVSDHWGNIQTQFKLYSKIAEIENVNLLFSVGDGSHNAWVLSNGEKSEESLQLYHASIDMRQKIDEMEI